MDAEALGDGSGHAVAISQGSTRGRDKCEGRQVLAPLLGRGAVLQHLDRLDESIDDVPVRLVGLSSSPASISCNFSTIPRRTTMW